MMHTRYTYHIRGVAENAWADQWYIGSRTATHGRTPEEDIGIHYFTSSTNDDFVAQFKAHPEWFVCTILERGYVSDVVMEEDEERRITESWNVPGRINRTDGVILFERDEAWKANVAAGSRKRSQSSEWKANNAAANRKSAQDPVHRATRAAANRKKVQSSEWKAKNAAAGRKNAQDPVWRAKQAAGARKMHASSEYQETRRKMRATPEWKAKNAAANRKSAQDPVHRATRAAANRKKVQSSEYQETMRKVRATPEWKAKNAAVGRKNAQDPEFGKKISDGMKRARALRDAAKTSTDTTDVLY